MKRLPVLLCLLAPAMPAAADDVVARYRDTAVLRSELGDDPGEVLRERILLPAVRDYLLAHRAQWQIQPEALERAVLAYRRSRACLPYPMPADSPETERFIAGALVGNALLQGWIHRRFGGGRLLFQQGGIEAFDANLALVEQLETERVFTIDDPRLRSAAYDYWTGDHGAALLPASEAATAFDPDKVFLRCDGDAPSTPPPAH